MKDLDFSLSTPDKVMSFISLKYSFPSLQYNDKLIFFSDREKMENASTNGDWTADYQGDNQILKILPVQNKKKSFWVKLLLGLWWFI